MTDQEPAAPDLAEVQRAYGRWTAAYVDLFDGAEKASAEDRAVIAGWAAGVRGRVLDAGCGPGHWSAFLRDRGVQVEGVDATEAFVAHAARAHPGVPFRQGDLRMLELPPASLGGVLAWFSLIHLDPAEVPAVLSRFADALVPGGALLIGFFAGPSLRTFDHRVVTAWAWPPEQLADAVRAAGFDALRTASRTQPNGRVVAELTARRTG
ncbi:class I SAM-dependent methyltransferase [Amnibacterium endophyticum]|uniref:Class I SAM-dependent methyltransferase n=1 Tax=Amnibacterium endophyticum TaxID=2109337 RepID=A0ABW4LDM1_9MICO